MTEKKQRFISLDEGYDFIIRDTITHNDLCDVDSVIDVLNDYDKENEQLKIQIDDVTNESIGYEEQIEKLLKKNERLKKERNHFERKKTEYLTEWNKSRIQNTELKKDNQELKEAMKRMMIEMMGGKME